MARMFSALSLLQASPLSLICFRHFSTVGPTVIRVPRALQLRAERASKSSSRRGETRRPILSSLPGRLLIRSRRPELSQHTGYTVSRIGRLPRLVSQGWKHRLAIGDHFLVNNTLQSVPSLPEIGEGNAPDFTELGICPDLVQTLSSQNFEYPTVVQSQTIPRLLKGNNVLCAAETGSGKTLGYLLPLLQRLLEDPCAWVGLAKETQGGEGMSTEKQEYSKGQCKLDIGTGTQFSNWQIKDHQDPVDVHRQVTESNIESPCYSRSSDKLQAKSSSFNTIVRPLVRRLARENGPKALVLVPSRELADQIYAVAARLTRTFSLKVKSIGGGQGMDRVQRNLLDPPDILVSTPGALCKALRRNWVTLQDLRYVVLDEADTLCDDSFKELVEEILIKVNISRGPVDASGPAGKAQLVVIGATFPKGVGELLQKFTDLGTITTIKSKRLHFLMPHVKQKFLKIKGADKLIELLDILKKREPGAGVLVFCNSAKTVNWLGYMLDDHTVQHLRLQGLMPADMRAGIFNAFQKGLSDVLVCTDIASRGLDSTRVDLVINYDFPPALQDYIHRAGRVGRVGSKNVGTVISFVTHKWDVELVQKIEIAARRRTSLPGMVSSINQPVPKTDLVQFDSEAKI